ncbi:MAG TPA: hypothetical protein VFQ53_43210 [Kofleriaceae bacterium]|nr:hypothetical protein [Kofleriaceae bacterium]
MTKDTERLETPAFTIEPGKLTRHGSGSSRTLLRFAAPAARHLDGGFDASVNIVLHDAQGRFIGRRGGSRDKTILGNRAIWIHEVDNDWIAQAARVTYEIEHRFDYRRKIVAGELPPLPSDADTSDYFRWLNLDPRTLEDRAVRFDFALWARSSELTITISQEPKLVTDSCRSELELDLLDGDHQLCFSRPLSTGLNYGQPSYDDTSISMDRRTLRMLKFFELRGRTEARALARLVIDGLPS